MQNNFFSQSEIRFRSLGRTYIVLCKVSHNMHKLCIWSFYPIIFSIVEVSGSLQNCYCVRHNNTVTWQLSFCLDQSFVRSLDLIFLFSHFIVRTAACAIVMQRSF